ncbi:MAG TPA: glycosyltransferase family 39 protein [bacterium]|nr:glycosyltransferase family 39 protein [bacterium]
MPRVPRPLLTGLLGLTAIRLALAATLPAGDDEAYYWEWSRHLAAGYVDHPPAVAYLVWLAVRILGRTPFALHLVAVALAFATSLALWTLAREVLEREGAATWAVVLFSIIPVFAAGSVLTAPDGPLFLCWVLTLLWTWRAANGGRAGAWLTAGVWCGLGLQSKYAAVALPVSVGLWLLGSPTHRRWLARPEPYAGCALALAIFAPVVWWNATHHWVSFTLTALGTSRWTEHGNFPFFIASQFIYLSPLMFPALIAGLAVAAYRWIARQDARWGFLAAAGWPVVLGACAGSLLVWAKPHWSAPGFLAAVIAAAGIATERPPRGGVVLRWGAGAVLGTAALLGAAFYALPFLTATVLSPRLDPAANYYGWAQAGPAIVAVAKRDARGPFFVASDWYQVMAPFDFSTGGAVPATTITGDDQYRFWTRLDGLRGWDGLFIRDSRQTYDVDLGQVCQSIEPGPSIPLVRGRVVMRTVDLVWCRHFAGRPVPRLGSFRWLPGVGRPGRQLTRAF